VLAIVIADFDAKERLLERYRHTRIGRHVWHHHEKRKARDAARCCRPAPAAPERGPEPQASLESGPPEK
jgi:hypothetical protein